MKELYIEKWESSRVHVGQIYKIDLEQIAKEEEDPKFLELEGDELHEYFVDWMYEAGISASELAMPILSVENYDDPDIDEGTYTSKKDALENISWRGFRRGEPYYMQDENGDKIDWEGKTKILADLEEELAEE